MPEEYNGVVVTDVKMLFEACRETGGTATDAYSHCTEVLLY